MIASSGTFPSGEGHWDLFRLLLAVIHDTEALII